MALQNIFTAVCNMTVTGSIVIGCVLLARLALAKAPRVFSWALWLVVIFRLLCPVSVPGPASVLELVDVPRTPSGTVEYLEMPVQAPLETILAGPEQSADPVPDSVRTKAPTDWNLLGTYVWSMGVFLLLAYGILSYVHLKRKLRESVPVGEGIREADGIASPFVLGLLRPTIYLPADLKAEERGYILLHEQLHLRHGDHIVKALFWLAVCLHWFNPLVWLAFVLCGRDMELRCDEAVLKSLGPQVRSDYAQSLLDLATGRHFVPAPLAFGEGDTGKRVKHVLKWKRGRLWIAIPAAVLCAAVLVLTACNPAEKDTPFGHSYRAEWVEAPADTTISADTLFTLTSDQVLFVREINENQYRGAFVRAKASEVPYAYRPTDLRRAWRIQGDSWWLTEQEDGTVCLIDESRDIRYRLARTDLLGVSIRQPGIESDVEPVWYRSGVWSWLPEEMSVTLVNEGARIILMPEQEVDMILVSEEYYDRILYEETQITTTDYFLEPDENGEFLLDISRRSSEDDDYAIYRVTVGEENYVFRLAFPEIPNETSVSSEVLNQVSTVAWTGAGAKILLEIPGTWEYDLVPAEPDGYAGGIIFWPRGREEGKLRFEYYPNGFGVCGTGLESTVMTVAGRTVSAGTYDKENLWTFLSFGDDFAVWGENHESWWAEYGDEAMEILNSAQFDK